MEKRFDHKNKEQEIYKSWEESGFFNPDNCLKEGITSEESETFSIVLPPPNVTGVLHMGHAAMLAIEDAMVRYHRMKGDKTLWVPGTDHAAIATQSKVEKIIKKEESKSRHDLGREEFLKRVDNFAQESHDIIESQIKRMGASVDWSREAFTLDEKRSHAVRVAFKRMYEDGLIYRGDRVVNWDPKGQTTVSDDEVDHVETEGTLYTFRYSKDFPIQIATTRPETKLGDTAVAVHPDDKRYKEFIGKEFEVKFCGVDLNIKIVADEEIDPEFGTGAVGVTPAHSFTDWEIAQRHNLPLKKVINEKARIEVDNSEINGLTTKEAREYIVEELKKENLLEKIEKIKQNISKAERTGGVIEPLPKLQWFIDVNKEFEIGENKIEGINKGDKVTLKDLMKKVVESGQIEILPDHFKKVYFHWIENLRDWCISRQIWYGHRIPVWYKKDGNEMHVGTEEPEGNEWTQDPDTLDTWFSAGLWTFTTLGWPGESDDFKKYHPTSVLETGYDILFFWVARMILMTTYHIGDIPFETVYLHGMVRDEKGDKMSKSKGNAVDPVDMIEKFGADATRLSLIIGTGPGNDISISEEKVKGYHKFVTKIWNASRFISMNKPENYSREEGKNNINDSDKKRIKDLEEIKKDITKNIDKFEFHLACEKAYHYFWDTFSNEVIEEIKPRVFGDDEKEKVSGYYTLEILLLESLKILHPFMPYVTEAIYEELKLGDKILMVEKWD